MKASALRANEDLRRLALIVGREGYILLCAVVGQGRPIQEVAEVWATTIEALPSGAARGCRANRHVVASRLRLALRDLAEHLGAKGPPAAVTRASGLLGVTLPDEEFDRRGRLVPPGEGYRVAEDEERLAPLRRRQEGSD